jgi:hypothetical protein
MTTNSKHYEELNIQPWEIMERNFTTEEFVAYLKGNIIKYTLRDKGQALTDAEKIKHYAEKLIEVIEKKETDEFLEEDAEHIYGKAEPVSEHKFKVGDRVRVLNSNKTGTIIRIPVEGQWLECSKAYIIELDNKDSGWKATKERHLVDSENAWYVNETDMVLLKEEQKKTLTPNKWYDAETFTVEELKKLLPRGTKVIVIEDYTTNKKDINEVELGKETWLSTTVQRVDKKHMTELTQVAIPNDIFFRRYFRIVEED